MPRPTPLARSPKRRRLDSRAVADAVGTSLSLPRTLHERARIAAIRLNWSYAEVIRRALGEWLDAHEPKGDPSR